jgi:phage/plasmid-associated DNA primase
MEALAPYAALVYTEYGFYEFDVQKHYWKPIYRQNLSRWLLDVCSGFRMTYEKAYYKKDEIDYTRLVELDSSEPHFFERVTKYLSNAPEFQKPEFFKTAPVGFTCRNGFVRITSTGPKLEVASKDHHSRIYLDCDWKADAECPFSTSVMASYFTHDPDAEGKQRSIYEFLAYCLLGQMCFDERGTIMWVTGAKRAGKTTILKALVNTVFPPEFVAHVEPQAFNEPNRKLDLIGKLINFRDEVGSKALMDVGTIKGTVSGAMGNIKQLYKDPINARIEAGHLFVANELPLHADPTGALQDRTIHISFDQSFDRDSESPKSIQAKMLNERSGLLALLVKHYYEAQAREPFETKSVFVPESAEKSRQEMTREANAYAEFIEDALEKAPDARLTAYQIATHFELWKAHTRRTYGPHPNVSTLGKKILAERPDFRVGNSGHAALYGVRLRDFKMVGEN